MENDNIEEQIYARKEAQEQERAKETTTLENKREEIGRVINYTAEINGAREEEKRKKKKWKNVPNQ